MQLHHPPKPSPSMEHHQHVHVVSSTSTRRMVILEHSVMIDNELTRTAARIACLPSHQHLSSTSYLQKEEDLIKILHRMDQQLSDLEQPAFSFSSSITARIRELARQSSELVANFMLFRDGAMHSFEMIACRLACADGDRTRRDQSTREGRAAGACLA